MGATLAIVSPIVGLLGTLLGLWIGHRRWRQELEIKDSDRFKEDLKAAYLELWDVVEDAHLKMRSYLSNLTAEVFSGFLTDVNSFMIRRGLFIEQADRLLVLEYLFWTNEYLRVLVTSPKGRFLMAITLESPELPSKVDMLGELDGRAALLREKLRSRIREIVGAPESSAWSREVRPSTAFLAQLDELMEAMVHKDENRASIPLDEIHIIGPGDEADTDSDLI